MPPRCHFHLLPGYGSTVLPLEICKGTDHRRQLEGMNALARGARTVGGAAVAAGIVVDFMIFDVDAGQRAVLFDKFRGYV